MSHPNAPAPQQPQVATQPRSGSGLLAAAILVAGIGGGLLAWHPWDKGPVPAPQDPQHITIQKVGEQVEAGNSDATQPVYCLTNETGGLYCMPLPNRYTTIQEERG
ncbi:hypothetical protein GCM10017786_04980 [Amycolatopsis deserti]|uniref:Uncharacterized protein n=1 Tax=Amycolatopsis deserti TaxID=185696 RepID=A0ABQ3IEP8_9PSEU|nr:hypothetical protein [Amycolatopsis deserti]GHE78339.1 hypothetical protein GCM10017786_04980 [Amycolatopsis deserti]